MDDGMYRQLESVASRVDFGEYEARAYVAVLEHGSLTAAEVAEKANIPQPRVYDTIRDLAESGLIELHESRPMRAVAIDPERAFTEVQSSLDELVSALSERFHTPARAGEVVSLVTSRQTVSRYFEDVITSAEYELVLALTPDLLARHEDALRERREEGVTTELLVAPSADAPGPDEYDYSAVATTARARRGVTTPVVAVADGSYSVYAPQTTFERDADSYGVIFNRSELGFLVSAFLNTVVWPSALTLVDTADDRPFPRRYATVRRCIDDLHELEGPFQVSVEGREVETGRRTSLEGWIVDVSFGANRETAALTVETAEGLVDVGGQLAAFEDVEADELVVDRP